MRSAETELQNTIELRATASEIVAPKRISTPERKKDDFEALFKRIFRRKITSAKNAFRARLPSKLHRHSSTSTTCNPIYSEGTILELQITMEFHRQLIHQHHLQSHLHCGNDPTVANHNGILSTTNARNTGDTPFTMRNRSENDPSMIRPHTRPSRNRRTAEVDHRGSGTDFVWKNIGFRASAISQKRISCETSFKTPSALLHQHHLQSHLQWGNDPRVANHNGIPSATHPPAPLAIPFTLRERSYSCKSQWNSVDHKCTKHSWHPIYNAEPIREWSEHDPTTHETVSQPSHRRGRSSRFGDGLCMEKHRLSCICYLSKTHFVRDFLQNSIGNSSTSTTCNPIYSEGTILELQITMEFHRQLIHQHPLAIPFTLRERSYSCKSQWNSVDHKCTKHRWHPIYNAEPIREWSEHDPTTHETVSQPSHRRGRSSRFGDGLCMEKHRLSCICYLSKTHFVRDFLQNSIGNSSTSTTCNPIYNEGTISLLTLSVTHSFPH